MKIIQIIIDKDKESTIIGLGDDGRVYVYQKEAGIWVLYANTTYEDSNEILHIDVLEN